MAPTRRYMSTAARVAEQKRMCPQFYCTHKTCLWRTKHVDGRVTPCPRHPVLFAGRCECYKGHNSSIGRCNVREVSRLKRESDTPGTPVLCERCERECRKEPA